MNTQRILALVCCCMATFFTLPSFAALSGTYTINPLVSGSSSNYESFEDAISDLVYGTRNDGGPANGMGVSGPVTFMVAAGTYNTQLEISGYITGASATNTVTFEGTDAATRIIEYEALSASARHTFKLSNVKYVTLRNLTVRTLGEYGWAIHISGPFAGSNKVIKCHIEAGGYGFANDFAGIVANNSNTNLATGSYMDSLVIDSNTIELGYYGISLAGNNGLEQLNNRISNNRIKGVTQAAIHGRLQDAIIITGNMVGKLPGQTELNYGILINSLQNSVNPSIINANTITSSNTAGIRIGLTSTANGKSVLSNNMISKAWGSGISMELTEDWNIVNNSISMIGAFEGTEGGISLLEGARNTIYNNLVYVSGKKEPLPLYVNDANVVDSMDYNVFFREDISDGRLVYINSDYGIQAFRGAGGFNSHSLYIKPLFINDSNLRVANSCTRGITFPQVTHDIDGTLRTMPPVIGAHEGSTYRNNLTVNAISKPVNPLQATGWQDIGVVVQNTGDSVIQSFEISYILNGAFPATQQLFNTNLQPCDTMTVWFTGVYQANFNVSNELIVYTALPNGYNDPYHEDDTLKKNLFMPLNGNYTIGGTTSDFPTFSAAASVLTSAGVSGPVKFIVMPGTYHEQVSISEPVPGSSDLSTVEFDGLNKDSVILTNAITTLNKPYTFHIASGFVTLRNLTIQGTSSADAYGILINRSDIRNVKIKSCRVELTQADPDGNFGGIIVAEGSYMYNEGDFRIDSVEIDSNIIINGHAGIIHKNSEYNMLPNSTALSISYNIVLNTYNGILVEKANGISINGNSVLLHATEGNNGIEIIYSSVGGGYNVSVSSNRITNGITGLFLSSIDNNTTDAALIANNVISANRSEAISISDIHNVDILHNSLRLTGPSDLYYLGALTATYCSDLNVRNNQFAVTDASTSAPVVFFAYSGNGLMLDHNNFYKSNTYNFAYIDGWFTRAAFAQIASVNSSPFFEDPAFENDSLKTKNPCLDGVATAVLKDIEGKTRSSAPGIGAYETKGVADDIAVVSVNYPVFPFVAGNYDLHVMVANRGANPITALELRYELNGGTPVSQMWSGNLAPCDTAEVVFNGINQVSVSPSGASSLKIYNAFVNNITDQYRSNDTITYQVSVPLNGTYTIGGTTPDYPTINAALNDLHLRGVDDAVTFRIRTGTYNEQMLLKDVQGASASNYITFISDVEHPDSVKLTYTAASLNNNYMIRFNDAHYFRISHLTLQPLNPALCRIIDLISPSSYDSVTYCKLAGGVVSTAVPQDNAVIYAYNFTGKRNVFSHNTMNGGSAGVYFYGLNEQDLADANVFTSNVISNPYMAGIYTSYTSNTLIHKNTITQGSSYTNPMGIYCFYADSAVRITSNRVTLTSGGHGINMQQCDGTLIKPLLVANNSISVTGSRASYGIRNQTSKWVKIYNNSVNVSTTNNTGYAAYFHYQTIAIHNNIDIRNNVLSNTGNGTAMYYYTTANSTVKCDYNNLYATAANLVQRGTPAATYSNIYLWRNASAQDLRSVSYRPGFTSAANLQPNTGDSASWSLNGYGMYLDSVWVAEDINGTERPRNYAAGAPDLGAYEFTPLSLPPAATPTGYLMPDSVQVFMFAADSVARIKWGALVPDNIQVRRHSGVIPEGISATADYMNFYTRIDATGSNYYNYDIDVYFRENWIGTNPVKQDILLSKKDGINFWTLVNPSAVDFTRNVLTAASLNTFSLFSGTNVHNPMPVNLLSFNGARQNNHVKLEWITAGERNNRGFEVQRGTDGKTFTMIGFVNGKGNASAANRYEFMDVTVPGIETKAIYYRLKQVDFDKAVSYSKTVIITNAQSSNAETGLSVFPNPFNRKVTVALYASQPTMATIEVYDITGQKLLAQNYWLAEGGNTFELNEAHALKPGIYILAVKANETHQTIKLIKQ